MNRTSSTPYIPHLICVLLFIFFVVTVRAQDPVCRTITKSNGLPSNAVYNLIQDKNGYIWMGHDKGISRYDGRAFRHYSSTTQQGRSLSNLVELGNGSIWCQDFSGNMYRIEGDSVVRDSHIESMGYYSRASVMNSTMLVRVAGNVLQSYDPVHSVYKKFKLTEELGSAFGYEKNKVMLINGNRKWEFDEKGLRAIGPFNSSVSNIFFLCWFGGSYYGISKNTFPVVSRLDDDHFVPMPLMKPGLFVQDVTVIDDLLWISTSSGAWCFGLDMKPAFGGHVFFEGKSISRILKDREGNYWFGTLDNGVLFVPDIRNRLYNYNNEKFTLLKLSADKNSIYAGTTNCRVLSFDLRDHSFKSIFKGDANHEVLDVAEDRKAKQLLVAADRIFFLDNGREVRQLLMAGKSFALINDDVFAMAHSGGVSLIAKKENIAQVPSWMSNERFRWESGNYFLTNTSGRGRSVAFDPVDSILYAGTASGLFYFSPRSNGKITFRGKDIFPSQIIIAENEVYASTFADGLFRINSGNVAEQVVPNGKPILKTIYKMFRSEDWLWLAGDGVLQRYDPDRNVILDVTSADGLPLAEIKDIVAAGSSLFVATSEGIAELDEYGLTGNTTAPRLLVNNVTVNGEPVDWKRKLLFKTNQNDLAIHFSLLTYREPDSLLVEYRLNNREWQKLVPGSRTILLSSLSPGSYTMDIRGFNEDGVMCEQVQTISFRIAAPFYERWWFLGGILLLGMSGIYVYFRWKLRNEKKRNELLAQKAALEQELQQSLLSSIKSQMNPHFLFNALNTVQSYIYTNEKENASAYLGKFSELTRMILDMSNKDIVPLSEEIRALLLYLELERLRFEDRLEYTMHIAEDISPETTYIHSMLIQPYVENAIKHGLLHQKGNWKLSIDFKKEDDCISVTIDDNGVGRVKSAEINQSRAKSHQSFASEANRKRLDILNQGLKNPIGVKIIDKMNSVGQATGTTVILSIPVNGGHCD